MRKAILVISLLVAITALTASAALASAPVAYTLTITDLGQGCWGGGALLANGSITGNASCAFNNGADIARLVPTSWSPAGSEFVTVCFDVVVLKGSGFPTGCATILVTGTPIIVSFGPGDTDLIRVTPVNP